MPENLNNPVIDQYIPPPGILICDRFNKAFGYRVWRRHGTRDWLITFTLSGSGTFQVGDAVYHAQPGRLTLIKPGTEHHYYTAGPESWEFLWAHFQPRAEWMRYMKWKEVLPGVTAVEMEPEGAECRRIIGAFERMIADSRNIGALGEELTMNALFEVLLLASRKQSAPDAEQPTDPRVNEVLRIMSQDLKKKHSVASLASAVYLSPSRLSQLFKRDLGDSVLETLIKLRLRHAARMLEFTDLNIAEIAEEVGFASPYYFTEQFSAFFGVSPSAYRRQVAGAKAIQDKEAKA
jgi:AraC family transcriptional regulator of arabinose operon